jgi:hypothetical protein
MKPRDPNPLPEACIHVREDFSEYLDGAIPGVAMAAIANHLTDCNPCAEEFAALRTVQQSLADLGPAKAPERLQAQLREAIATEHAHGTHLPFTGRFLKAWNSWLAPAALRASSAFVLALVLLGTLGWMFAAPITSVQANDDNQANLIAPRFLYSAVPPEAISADNSVPVMVEAKVNTDGQVYDYTIIAGPTDPASRIHIEENLLSSVFKPATLFGVKVPGHVMLTYSGISVRG